MAKTKVLCYHGSPGTDEDFAELAKVLPEADLLPVARKGYPSLDNAVHKEGNTIISDEPVVVVGYSWGCVAALRDVAQSTDKVKGVVLIAPFLGGQHIGTFKHFLLTNSFLGSIVIGMAAGGVVSKLFKKSCQPKEIPPAYAALRDKLAKFEVLSRAGLEKTEEGMDPKEACEKVKAAQIPTMLIWGKEDANDHSQEYADLVKAWLEPGSVVPIEDGGHALLWTHPQELAKAILEFLSS